MYLYIILAVCVGSIVAQNAKRGRVKTLDTLIKRSAKYATMAQQDASPLHSVVHANHAMAFLTAAQEVAGSDNDIRDATGIDMTIFKDRILNVQHEVTQKTLEKCPQFKGDVDLYLSAIADA